jgi:DNA-binding LacI/PurR family transcriptional regulator
MASIKEIARMAQVSQATASMVLGGKGDHYRISPATQRKILEAARQLNYKPNISARRLRSGGEEVLPIIALFWVMDTRAVLISRFLKGLQNSLNGMEGECEIMIQPYVGSRLSQVHSLFTGTRFNGAIIANPTEEDERFLEQADLKMPIVLYQRNSAKYSCVNVDSRKAGAEVARLFASRGHRQVGLVVPNVSSSAVRQRMEGFLSAAGDLGLHVPPQLIVSSDYSEEGGYTAIEQLHQCSLPYSALFIISDQMAIGALKKFHDAGIRIPADVEIVGFDDDPGTQYTIPTLSTVHLPVEEMAGECLNVLMRLMNHQAATPLRKMFDTHIIMRQSCGGAPF